MKIRNIDCPSCGSNITISGDGFNKCPFCSHELYAEQKKDGNIIINTTINRYTSDRSKAENRSTGANLRGIAILVILITVISYTLFTLFFSGDDLNFSKKKEFRKPFNQSVQSSQMIRFVEIAFQKKFDEIQRSDYERVKMIIFNDWDRNDGDFQIEYQLEDGTAGAVKIMQSSFTKSDIPLSDFQCFTNLEVLDFNESNQIERYYAYNDSEFEPGLKNLEHLTKFGGQMYLNIEEIPDIVHDPSKLTYVSGSLFNENLVAQTLPLFKNLQEMNITYINSEIKSGLHAFSKLEKLEIVRAKVTDDNSYLNTILNLKELYLNSNSDFKHYQFLNGLPNLEKLEIDDAFELRSVDFISGMPKLRSFGLSRSIIKDLKPLENNESIEELYLSDNAEIKDYSIIETLKNLKSLQIQHWALNSQIKLPDLTALTGLKKLNIEQRMLRKVQLPDSIESLSINVPLADEFDLNIIPKLTNLKQLHLHNSGYLINAHAIHKFPKLESLVFRKTRLWRFDFTEILNSKTLKNLELHEIMNFSLKPSSVGENNILEKIYMNHIDDVYLFQGSIEDINTQKSTIGEVSDIFRNLHALKDITLIDCDMEDLSFTQGTPELEYMDLTKNYVNDISPLTKLNKLKLAILTENPVANAHLLEGKIYLGQ